MPPRGEKKEEFRVPHGMRPPCDLQAEAMVLSELLASPGAFDRVQGFLQADRFWSQANKRIYECILHLQTEGKLVDTVSVAALAKDRGQLDQIGGTPYLTQIATATPAPGAYLEQHAERIRDLWRRRQAISMAQQVAVEGFGDVGDGQEWLEQVEHEFSVLAHEHATRQVLPIGELAAGEVYKLNQGAASGSLSGVRTGFGKLDHLTTGLHAGDLYIVAGRPGMGKTAFVTSLLMNISRPKLDEFGNPKLDEIGNPVQRQGALFFSLEQPKEQIAMRVLCAEAGADFSRVRQHQHHRDDINKITDQLSQLGNIPLYIDDKPALTLMELRSEVRKLKRQFAHGIAPVPADRLVVVAVDYIQLMQAEKAVRDRGSREQEVSSFSQGLKRIAKEEDVAVLALSQLNRSVESRADKHPQLADLRESGAIEQDADCIMFLYRKGYYEKESDDRTCDIDIAKQRNGPTDIVKVIFEPDTMRFRSLTDDEAMGGEPLPPHEEENPDGY